jgi:NAD(P)-dependent dehydrogenase (short-subunit alcohol dehydrogenase family)
MFQRGREGRVTVGLAIPEPAPLDSVLSLQGKCAVLTGGSRGLGAAIVQRPAEAGAVIVLTGRQRVAVKMGARPGQQGTTEDHSSWKNSVRPRCGGAASML